MSSSASSPDSNPTPSPEVIEAAAAAWLSLRDRGLSAAETAEFVRWLQQDAQHAAVFEELESVWKDFDRLGAVPLTGLATAPAANADLLVPRVRPHHHRTWAWGSLAVAAAAALALLAVPQFRTPAHTAETAIGAFQKFDLPDGSVAQLNTDSAIDLAFTPEERRVHVVRGEIFFTVTKNPQRPFIVTSGPVSVRAVGTAFNVRQNASSVEVLVTEGKVEVARVDPNAPSAAPAPAPTRSGQRVPPPALLVAGERATVPTSATAPVVTALIEKISAPAAARTLAWQERRLEFDAAPLAEVVREFNRYNRRQLVITDAELATKRFTGTFRADGDEPFVRLLETDFGISATRSAREVLLRTRR